MNALRQLCGCGTETTTRLNSIQAILGSELERYGSEVASMLAPEADLKYISLYGCFAARKMLEAGCFALLSRIDPTRLLILREFQIRGRYELDDRHSASLDWQNDVVSEKKAGWNDPLPADKFMRSLLGGHMAEVTWLAAVDALVNKPYAELAFERSKWISEIIGQYESRRVDPGKEQVPLHAELGVLAGFRTLARQTFSTLSKGVHLEFVVDQQTLFDAPTILQTMKSATKVLTQMAFVSHFIDCAFSQLPLADSIEFAIAIEKEIEGDA